MRDRFLAAWRTAAQTAIPLLLTVLLHRGIHVPDQLSGWLETALIGAGTGVWAAMTHWLQSRTGPHWWDTLARGVGRVLVLGAKALPTYATPPGTPADRPASAP
jgi:hypothetical protein